MRGRAGEGGSSLTLRASLFTCSQGNSAYVTVWSNSGHGPRKSSESSNYPAPMTRRDSIYFAFREWGELFSARTDFPTEVEGPGVAVPTRSCRQSLITPRPRAELRDRTQPVPNRRRTGQLPGLRLPRWLIRESGCVPCRHRGRPESFRVRHRPGWSPP